MTHYQRAGLLVYGPQLHLLARVLVEAEQSARKRGACPLDDTFFRFKAQVEAAIAAEATASGHETGEPGYRLVTTSEYAQLTGRSRRTAQRYARTHGTFVAGRWMIRIKE